MTTFTFRLLEVRNLNKKLGEVSFVSDVLGARHDDAEAVIVHLIKLLQSTIQGDTTTLRQEINNAIAKYQQKVVLDVPIMASSVGERIIEPPQREVIGRQSAVTIVGTMMNSIFGDAAKEFNRGSVSGMEISAKAEVARMQREIEDLKKKLKEEEQKQEADYIEYEHKLKVQLKINEDLSTENQKMNMELRELRRQEQQPEEYPGEGNNLPAWEPKPGI